MGNKYKIINDRSCLGVMAYGKNIKELFEHSAFAMFSQIAAPAKGARRETYKITVTADNTEELLIAFFGITITGIIFMGYLFNAIL